MFETWEELEEGIKDCKKCKLCERRNHIVVGVGNRQANIMFIGEGPGADEDTQGIPFVGKAGKLMDKALEGLGIKREKIYITNIVKCRPPQNRVPEKEEVTSCIDYLRSQVLLVKPKIIVLLGSTAFKNVLGEDHAITKERGVWIEHKGIWYMPTFHPAALLRDESKKIAFWKDLKLVKEKEKEITNGVF